MDKQKTAPVIHERPKMPRATWEALRNHIMEERRRKQEEEGKAEEYERQKKERENKKMLEATSLGETKEQIAKLEEKLTSLKEEKHQLFLTLKKVLNEDETRRRKETSEMNILYPQHGAMANFPLSGHVAQNNVAMYLHPQSRQPAMYLKPHSLPAGQLPPQAIKRQRTPSPPRTAAHYRGSGRTGTSSVYGHPAASGAPIYSSSSYHFPGGAGAGAARDEERKQPGQPVYLAHSSHQARYAGSLHPAGSSKTGPGLGERARLAAAAAPPPAAHAQLSSSSRGYPAGASLPPRLAYTQAAQLVAAQQLAAQQAAAQAAAGGPPTTRFYTGSLHGREV